MNNKGQQFALGFGLLVAFMIFILALFATIEPFKETFDEARGNAALNCPGTPNFNQTDYDDDDKFEKLNQRTTCFVTGIGMVWFVGAFLITSVVWLFRNWVGKRR